MTIVWRVFIEIFSSYLSLMTIPPGMLPGSLVPRLHYCQHIIILFTLGPNISSLTQPENSLICISFPPDR